MQRYLTLVFIYTLLIVIANKATAQGGFGGVHTGIEVTSNGNMLLMGGGGAWVINSNFYLGGAGYGGANTLTTSSGELNSLGYGGVMFGYFNEVKESVRLGGEIFTGSGGYNVDDLKDDFYFVEPNLKVWYSINSTIHITAGAYYRIGFVNADAILSEQDLSNFGIKLTLNFGKL